MGGNNLSDAARYFIIHLVSRLFLTNFKAGFQKSICFSKSCNKKGGGGYFGYVEQRVALCT